MLGGIEGGRPRGELENQGRVIPFERAGVPLPEWHSPVEIKRFTPEAWEALEKQGYVIYRLNGESIKSMKEAGRSFYSKWHNILPKFEALPSMHSEVAINPDNIFLPESDNKTLKQQEALVEKFSQELRKTAPNVSAIIGQVSDYVELAFQHLDATGQRLFGKNYDYNYARTKTPTSSRKVADVGYFHTRDGLTINEWFTRYGADFLFVAPLVVPV